MPFRVYALATWTRKMRFMVQSRIKGAGFKGLKRASRPLIAFGDCEGCLLLKRLN